MSQAKDNGLIERDDADFFYFDNHFDFGDTFPFSGE